MKVVEYLIEKIICPLPFKWRKAKNSIFFKLPVYTNNAFHIKIRWKISSKHYFKRNLFMKVHAQSLSHLQLLWPHGLKPTRLLCPWHSPGKNTGVGCHSLLQGIFLIQGLNPVSLIAHKLFTIWATREALILVCTFLFCDIFFWFWHQGDSVLAEWPWECSFFCNFLGGKF